tara:strand:- start:575 stop:718 length:144 start_codon:yes stop_codon:yes gene_type:complete
MIDSTIVDPDLGSPIINSGFISFVLSSLALMGINLNLLNIFGIKFNQ